MNNRMKKVCALAVCFMLTAPFASMAQRDTKSEIVNDPSLLAKLAAAVEANPDSLSFHKDYIKAMGSQNPKLEGQYDAWMKKYPNKAVIPYALSKAYLDNESPKAKPYLLKTVALDPKYTEAWGGLWMDAERWGDFQAGRDYLAKAVASDPSNPNYNFYYASSFSGIDKKKYVEMSMEVAKKFPDHERGAQAVYWLGERSSETADKIKYFELARTSFNPAKFNWAANAMSSYYNLMLSENPTKAIELAAQMAKDPKNEKEWSELKVQAEQVAALKVMMSESKSTEALKQIAKIKLPRYFTFNKDLILIKSQAYALAGNTTAAYDSLIVAFTKSPALKIKTAIIGYGKKLNKNAEQVDADIWKRLDAVSALATPFTLKRYLTAGNTSLSDYKGKVVLLTYWFPGCGPCRGEFPHFENVVKKFDKKDLEYVGINIVSDQNDYVLPFMKTSGYSFTPLEDVKDRKKGNLDNRGAAPANFLIDQEGRVLFSNFRTSENNEDELESMINMVLARQKPMGK